MRTQAAQLLGRAAAVVRGNASGFRTLAAPLARFGLSAAQAAERASHSSNGAWGHGAFLVPAALAAAAVASSASIVALESAKDERTFIMVKPDGVQRGQVAEIISRFERKGYKLVAIKIMQPTKDFAKKHYADLDGRPFFNGLCDFLSSGPVVAMVWEGQEVIKYGRKFIGATNPLASEPGTIRGDLAVSIGRNMIHGSDGPEGAKAEIALWFKPEELVSYTRANDKWIYE